MAAKIDTPAIYESMRHKLVTAVFPPGQKLKPAVLIGDYGCSINTLREVLLRLSAVGLVTFEDQRGFRACAASARRQHDLTRFRILLEQEGATHSIRNGGLEWEARLTAAHHKLWHIESHIADQGEIAPMVDLWCAAEWEFHETLMSACDSALLRQTFAQIYDQFRQQMVTRENNFGYFSGNLQEHADIVAAALDRDEPLVRRRIHDHLSRNLITIGVSDATAQSRFSSTAGA